MLVHGTDGCEVSFRGWTKRHMHCACVRLRLHSSWSRHAICHQTLPVHQNCSFLCGERSYRQGCTYAFCALQEQWLTDLTHVLCGIVIDTLPYTHRLAAQMLRHGIHWYTDLAVWSKCVMWEDNFEHSAWNCRPNMKRTPNASRSRSLSKSEKSRSECSLSELESDTNIDPCLLNMPCTRNGVCCSWDPIPLWYDIRSSCCLEGGCCCWKVFSSYACIRTGTKQPRINGHWTECTD